MYNSHRMTYTQNKVFLYMKKIVKPTKKFNLLIAALAVGVITVLSVGAVPQMASAQTSPDEFNSSENACKPGTYKNEDGSACATPRQITINPAAKPSLVEQILNPAIKLMTAIVGIIIAISLVAAAVTYSSAGGDPGRVAAAKKRITNSIIALIAYIFTFGLLQWLVPGGIV